MNIKKQRSCIILCGGQSRRMGQDKGSMIIRDKPMINHILSTLNNEINEVIIVLNNKDRIDKYKNFIKKEDYNFKITFAEDEIKNIGPMSGILTGLKHITSDYALILPCDSPYVTEKLIENIFNELDSDHQAIVPYHDSKNVERVKLKNNSVSPLILLDGEEIAGSLQNRIVAQTMIIPPKSEMEIPVNCSEKGRNEYKSEFQYSDYIANSNTRRKKAYNKNNPLQEVVWNSIDDLETDKNTSSKTKALRDSYEKNKYDIDSYLKHFKMENNQIGVICIVENKVGIEIFNNHSLYEKYDEMLLRSYIIDSSSSEKINISDKELENILASINEDSFIKKEAVGLGKYYKISNSYGNGHILIYENNMVHTSFFKKIEIPTVNNEIIKNIQNNKQTIC